MREPRRDYPNDIGPRGQDLLRRTLDPYALEDTAHYREVLVTPGARPGLAAARDICLGRERIARPIQGWLRVRKIGRHPGRPGSAC